MSDINEKSVGERAIEHTGPEPPAQPPLGPPQGVLIGAGGDPLIIGLPMFALGSIALGFALVGVVSSAGLGTIIPEIAAASAFWVFIGGLWAIGLGQSIVACIFGIFSGFWGSLTLFLLGLDHHWFAIPPADLVHAQLVFFISWDIVVFLLLIPVLRLPVVYVGVIVFVIAALTLVVLGLEYPGSVSTFNHLAGICTFIFAGLGLYAFLNVSSVATGGPPRPPLGPPVIK